MKVNIVCPDMPRDTILYRLADVLAQHDDWPISAYPRGGYDLNYDITYIDFAQRFTDWRQTPQRFGPVNVALTWDGDPTHDPWRIATDQPARIETLTEYALRMGIDLGFLDDKSAGFQVQETELAHPRRLDHLLLVTALFNLYLVSLGTHVVHAGQPRLIDSHWQRRLSYQQLGWRWLDNRLACDAPLPMTFFLDPQPDPEPLSTISADQFAA